jgi:hypothetical protein
LDRLDPLLRVEIDRAKVRGLDIKKIKFGVIIEHKEAIGKLRGSTERQKAIREVETLAARKLSSIVSRLEQLGANQKLKLLPFANSVYAELTYDQIMEVNKLEDIKTVRLSNEENVTC